MKSEAHILSLLPLNAFAVVVALFLAAFPVTDTQAASRITHLEILHQLGFPDTPTGTSVESEDAFALLDDNADQLLSLEEFAESLGYGELFVETLYSRFDDDGSGSIDPNEWSAVTLAWASENSATSHVFLLDVPDELADTLINEWQYLGTHNSYHIALPPELDEPYYEVAPDLTQSVRYTHLPLQEQFSGQGIRQIELDILADPQGGRYANPLGPQLVYQLTGVWVASHDEEELAIMKESGLKVLHLQDLDTGSRCPTFRLCLKEIRDWSGLNPSHVPIFVLVEAKDAPIDASAFPDAPNLAQLNWNNPPPLDPTIMAEIDSDILAVFEPEHLLLPADVRGSHATLRDAILTDGWPTLAEAAGRVYFGLDNGGEAMDMYEALHPDLETQILFTNAPIDSDRAAFVKRNDPYASDIPDLVKQGYLVRTRTDFDTWHSVHNDVAQRDQAFASGAQFLSTDYPVANLDYSDYSVAFENNSRIRCNPQNATADCSLRLPEPTQALLQAAGLLALFSIRRSRRLRAPTNLNP